MGLVLGGLMFVQTTPVLAQSMFDDGSLYEAGRGTFNTEQDLGQVIGTIISVLIGFLGIIFLVLTVYAGFLWMTAAGNEKQVGKAKNILVTAVIGLVITLSAYTISTFVVGQLTDVSTGTSSSGDDEIIDYDRL